MKTINKYERLLVVFSLFFIFFQLALPHAIFLTKRFIGYQSGYANGIAYAEDEEPTSKGEEEKGATEGEDDKAYLKDIGIAKEHVLSEFSFPVIGNRKATWLLAQLHILFASFILGCPMFVVVMEVLGAKRTSGVKKACIFANVFLTVLIGTVVGITGEIIGGIHHGVLIGLAACAITGLLTSSIIVLGDMEKEKAKTSPMIIGVVVGIISSLLISHGIGAIVLGVINGIIGAILSKAMIYAPADDKFERLSHEVSKVIGMCYSFTALTGGFFLLVMMIAYPAFISYLLRSFPTLSAIWYPTLFVVETILMYSYVYSWDPLTLGGKKGTHISIGIFLNIVGLSLLLVMDAPTTFMLTPPTPVKDLATMSEMTKFLNFTWMPLNYHRLVGNATFGGYMVGIISAYMYLWSNSKEDKEYYDWQGYIANAIGVGAMLPLPAMGYIFVREIYTYDAAIGMYIMSDRESMFMLTQGLLIGIMFLGSNLYMYASMKRIERAERFFPYMKIGFILVIIAATIWFTPRRFYATMMPEQWMKNTPGYLQGRELPDKLAFLALMISKNTAAFTLVLVTAFNYILYNIAARTGKVSYGNPNPLCMYLLIFIGFTDIWLMSWMGSIREFARKEFHIYKVFKDITPESYTLTLGESGKFVTLCVWIFFIMMTFIIWLSLKYPKSVKAKVGH